MDKEYSAEPIEKEDLCIFADKTQECLRDSGDKLWECLHSPEDKRFADPDEVELMVLCQGGGLHYAFTHGDAKKYLDPKKMASKM
jgi:hypothetical protein